MTITDEQLAAYVDGELDPAAAEAVRREIAESPDLERQVHAQRALTDRLRRSFDRTLDEPVPTRLRRAVESSRVVDAVKRTSWHPARAAWFAGLAAAAGLVLGVVLAPSLTHGPGGNPDIVAGPAGLTAAGELAMVLSNQLASEQPRDSRIHLGASFLAKTGGYCRTFIMDQPDSRLSGMACRQDGGWALKALHEDAASPGEAGEYRQAATTLSPFVLQAAGAIMSGDALDARAEAAARNRDWQRSTAIR